MRKILTLFAAVLCAAGIVAAPVVLPATLDVSNVSFRSENLPNFVVAEGEYAGTYFDMGAHDSSNDTLLYAEWDVTIQPMKYNLAVDVYNTNSWRVEILLLNQAGDTVKSLRYKGSSGQCGQFAAGSMDLSDLQAGNYKVRAHCAYAWSAMKLKDIIFEADYQGVSVELPGTLQPAYALLSANASVTNNAIAFKPSTAPDEYATWNVSFAKAGDYNVSIDITASNGHNYGVALLSADGTTGLDTVAEGAQMSDTGVKELGAITVPAAGKYVVKLTNATQWSEAVLNSITFAAPVEPKMQTIYCKMDKAWWTADGAAVGIYTWNDKGEKKANWPGERMTAVEGENGVWSFELDVNTYHMCIFTRVNGTGDIADWGAKTADLTIPTDDKDLYTITSAEAVWGDPGVAGEWSKFVPTPAPQPAGPYYSYVHTKFDKNSAYNTAYDVTVNEMPWSIMGNLATDASTRFGGKSLTNVDKPMYTKAPMAEAIDSIIIRHYGVSSDKLKVNSITLEVASDAAFANLLDSIELTTTIGKNDTNTVKFAPANAAANSYYRITYNLTNPNNSNYAFLVYQIDFYKKAGETPEPPVTGCEWDKLNWLGDGSAEQTFGNQFKVCVGDPAPNVVNIQTPGFAAATGIYMTFPSADWGEISLAENQYKKDGAGIVLYLTAFTAKETEVTINCASKAYVFTVYNDKAAEPQPDPEYLLWQVAATTDSVAGVKYIDNEYIEAKTVYNTKVVPQTANIFKAEFTHAVQVRVNAWPTAENPTGTEQAGSTPLVITAKKDAKVTFYYMRQAVNKSFGENDNKDVRLFDQAAPTTAMTANSLVADSVLADSSYYFVAKEMSLVAGHTYTLAAKGTTLKLFGILYPGVPAPVVEHIYTVAGNNPLVFGKAWDPADLNNQMAKQEDGSYKWEETELNLGVEQIEFKVCEDTTWAVAYPKDNYKLDITEAGIYTITITFNPATTEVTAKATKTGEAPVLSTCADVYTMAKDSVAQLNPVTVTYVNGVNVYVKDATAGMLIYLPKNTTAPWKAGDILSGVEGKVAIYKGLYEVSPTADQVAAVKAVDGEAPAPEKLTAIDVAKDMNKYILLENVAVQADTFKTDKGTSIELYLGNDTITLYNKFKLAYTFEEGKTYNVVALVSYYDALQIYFLSAEEYVEPKPVDYFLMGSMNGWAQKEEYKFAANPDAEGEYMLTTTLAVNDELKVASSENKWYPDGMGNNYKVDAAHAGEAKTIYFRPAGNEDWKAFHEGGFFYIAPNEEPMDTIPTTAPAAPTAADDDVLAIYCGKYTNNLNFAMSGWANPGGAYEDLDIEGTRVGYKPQMTWECIIDPINTDNAHDMSGYKKLHVDIWAPKAAKIKFVVEAVAGGNYKDGQMVDLAKGWNAFDFVVAEWPGNYDFKNAKCFVFEQYKTPGEGEESQSFEGNPFAFANIYFYDKEGQGLEDLMVEGKAVKVMYNGQIIILKNGKQYTIMGAELK